MGKTKYEAKLEPLHPHFCVDRGKPTPNHRCRKCLNKWKRKHGVTGWELPNERNNDDNTDTNNE